MLLKISTKIQTYTDLIVHLRHSSPLLGQTEKDCYSTNVDAVSEIGDRGGADTSKLNNIFKIAYTAAAVTINIFFFVSKAY